MLATISWTTITNGLVFVRRGQTGREIIPRHYSETAGPSTQVCAASMPTSPRNEPCYDAVDECYTLPTVHILSMNLTESI